jgi:hypothetical protein
MICYAAVAIVWVVPDRRIQRVIMRAGSPPEA